MKIVLEKADIDILLREHGVDLTDLKNLCACDIEMSILGEGVDIDVDVDEADIILEGNKT